VSDKHEQARHIWQPVVDRLEGLIDDHVHEAIAPLTQRIEQHEHRLTALEQQTPSTEAMMSNKSNDAEQEVNDATPTNSPEPTPAETELGGDPPERRGDADDNGSETPKPNQGDRKTSSRPEH
jgi:hypothetical protein